MIGGVVEVELARHQWEEGRRALQAPGPDAAAARALARQVEILSAELTRRLGQVFTLAELVAVYEGADRWSIELLQEAFPDEVPASVSTAADAAFELRSRYASDYVP
jgi:hypothetical protein